jgi:transcriptional regulator with XRE-family HTH domain
MFWKNFYVLCERKNMKPLHVVKALGISAGSITAWKNGSIPTSTTLQKLADYFGVTVEYFFTDHSEEAEAPVGKGVPFSKYYQNLSAEDFLKELRGMDSNVLVDLLITLNKMQNVVKTGEDLERITEEERTLLELFRQVPPDKRASFIDIARVYAMSLKTE